MNRSFSFIGVFLASAGLASVTCASGLPKESLQVIVKSLQDTTVEVRIAAAQALAQTGNDTALKPLESALMISTDANEQTALAQALEALNEKSTFKRLSEALANPQFTWGAGAKAKAVEVIGVIGERKAIKELTILAGGEQEPAVKAAAIRALGTIGAPPKKEDKK